MADVWGGSWGTSWGTSWAEAGVAPAVGYGLSKQLLTGVGGDDLGDEEVSEES